MTAASKREIKPKSVARWVGSAGGASILIGMALSPDIAELVFRAVREYGAWGLVFVAGALALIYTMQQMEGMQARALETDALNRQLYEEHKDFLQGQIANLVTENADIRKELEAARRETKEQQRATAQEINNLSAVIDAKELQLEALRERLDNLDKELKKFQEANSVLRRNLDAAREEADKLLQENQALKEENKQIPALQEKVDLLEKQVAVLERQVKALQTAPLPVVDSDGNKTPETSET